VKRGIRLGFDGTLLGSGKSGIGYHTEYLARALAETSECAEILLFSNRPPVFDAGTPDGIRVVKDLRFPLRAPWLQFMLPALLRRTRPDLMHYINFNAPVFYPHPYVVTFHDTILLRHPELFSWKKRRLSRSILPRVAGRARGVFTVTRCVRDEVRDLLGVPEERIHVVPPAPGDIFQAVEDPAVLSSIRDRYGLNEPYLLFVGSLEPRKNLERLIRAFDLCRRSAASPYNLVVVGGRGWRFAPVFETVASLSRPESVRFLDYVPLPDLPAIYTLAEAFAFPSLDEGFGVPPLEAMRCGTPALVSDIPPLREVCGDAALFVDPGSVVSLARGITRILSDEALRTELKDRGRKKGIEFTWARSARLALAGYERALEG
jgi:glycosyltransferase involved in cell wall biosynthesis